MLNTYIVANASRERNGGILAVVNAALVEVANVDLHAAVILRLDKTVGPAALTGNVKVNVLALRVNHVDASLLKVSTRKD